MGKRNALKSLAQEIRKAAWATSVVLVTQGYHNHDFKIMAYGCFWWIALQAVSFVLEFLVRT